MDTADKLMKIAIDGDADDETVVTHEPAASDSDDDSGDGEVVAERTVTTKTTVREGPAKPGPAPRTTIVEV
jgi:hypothetical protein